MEENLAEDGWGGRRGPARLCTRDGAVSSEDGRENGFGWIEREHQTLTACPSDLMDSVTVT